MARKLKVDEWLFAATVGLVLFGVVMVYSASAVVASAENNNQYHYVMRQGMWVVIGFAAMFVGMNVDYRILRDRRIVYGLLAVTVFLLLVVFAFPPINGARRWIRLGGMSMQPSELAKFALLVYLARYLEQRAGEENVFGRTFFPTVGMTAVVAGLVLVEPDLGTALMLVVGCAVLLFTAGVRLKHLGIIAAPAIAMFASMLIFVPWRFARLMTFINPWRDPQGSGYQIIQSLLAVGSGGVEGLGFAQGRQKMFFLPFAHSDFIYAVVAEELGLFGALFVVVAFGLFLWRGVKAARNAPDRFGMLLGMGIVSVIVVQALFNMSVVVALLPTKGIPLPFISHGGSSLVPTLFSVGVLLNISQHGGNTSGSWSDFFTSREMKRIDRLAAKTRDGKRVIERGAFEN